MEALRAGQCRSGRRGAGRRSVGGGSSGTAWRRRRGARRSRTGGLHSQLRGAYVRLMCVHRCPQHVSRGESRCDRAGSTENTDELKWPGARVACVCERRAAAKKQNKTKQGRGLFGAGPDSTSGFTLSGVLELSIFLYLLNPRSGYQCMHHCAAQHATALAGDTVECEAYF